MTPEEEWKRRRRFFELAQSMPPPQPSPKVIERERLRKCVLKELLGGLWHTTHPDRFQAILKTGAILPEPDIPDSERWSTSQGPRCWPYVRTIGGVSLFDLEHFDAETYSEKYPSCDWRNLIPFHQVWRQAAWIEIDRHLLGSALISGSALIEKWRAESCQTIMPYIEAAHIGPIPCSAFKRAFLVSEGDRAMRPIPLTPPPAHF